MPQRVNISGAKGKDQDRIWEAAEYGDYHLDRRGFYWVKEAYQGGYRVVNKGRDWNPKDARHTYINTDPEIIAATNRVADNVSGSICGSCTPLTEEQSETLSHFVYNPVTDRLEADKPIETTLSSLFLGDQHRMSSGGENVFFTNQSSNINWHPMWGGLKDMSVSSNRSQNGIIKPSGRNYSNYAEIELNGPVNSGITDGTNNSVIPLSVSGVGADFIIEENILPTETIYYRLWYGSDDSGVQAFESKKRGVTINSGEYFEWYYEHPVEVHAGQEIFAKLEVENENGETRTMQCRQSVSGAAWVKLKAFEFTDDDLAFKDDIAAIVTGSVYKGAYDADTQTPDLTLTGNELNGDFYRVSVSGGVYEVGDLLIYNSTTSVYDHIPVRAVTQNKIETSGLKIYDKYVKANYVSDIKDGSSLNPYSDIETAIADAVDGDSIYLDGEFTISSVIIIPSDKSLYFYGNDTTKVKYSSFSPSNDKIFYQSSSTCTKEYFFENIKFSNSGDYAVYIRSAKEVKFNNCDFNNNGWSGNGLSTVVSDNGSTLGYDSSQSDLQSFWASSETSDGGAMRIRSTTIVNVVDCKVYENLRGLRIQDCGAGGYGYISRNQCYNNIESGIYLASGSYNATNGCENFTVYNNASKYNANNGILVIGGINNVVSLNIVEGNWNAGIMGWHVSNTRFRDLDLTNNNRSAYNGIGNTGDAHSSITIGGNTARASREYIADVLSTEVYNTGLGSNTSRIGFQILEDVQEVTDDYEKTLINIDNVGFKKQDYAIDCLADLDVVKLTIGDCRYIETSERNVNIVSGYYYELPFSNHHTDVKSLDVSLDDTNSRILCKESSTGDLLNPYGINDLQAIAFGSKIRIILRGSSKIQFEVEVANTSINGVMVNSVLANALVNLNNLFTATSSFISTGNPVTAFNLVNNDLTITLQDGTSYTVDVTTLGVDENKFVSSGQLNGSNLELTMNDSSVVTIDVSNMINGSTLPALSNSWFIAYGNNAGDEVTSAGVIATIKDKQPFYNGDFLEKGEEYIWTHDDNGGYMLGVWSGAESTVSYSDIFNSVNWSASFAFNKADSKVSETDSVGVDVASRYASGYAITNNTVLALRYGNDNHLYLLDISDGGETIIGKSNVAQVGDEVTIFFTGGNQPNAKFPVMVKRYDQWTIVHDFDNSENGEWNNGVETDTIIKSNIELNPGEKILLNFNYFGRAERIGLGYTGASSGVSNAWTNIEYGLVYNSAELLFAADTLNATGGEWTWNQNSNEYWNPNGDGSSVGYWNNGGASNLGLISIIYNTDNSVQLYHEGNGEFIADLSTTLDGSPINIYIGFNEAHPTQRIPAISRQDLSGGSQPITNFAPDISNQTINITEGTSFNAQIALDAGSDIVTQYVEEDAPSWAILNQSTGEFTGTAPAYNGSSDAYVINCKAGNPVGGVTPFQVTLNVQEITYTNTKSLFFEDGVSSYLGGNAALVTSLERSGNGSGVSDAWSFEIWWKGSTANSGQTVMYFGANDVVNNGYIELRQTNHNGLKRLRLRYGSNANHLQLTTPSGSINPSNWQHILVTYDGGTTGASSGSMSSYYSRFKIYIDGVLQTTSNTHSNYGYSGSIVGQNFRFGRFASGTYAKDMTYNQMAIWDSDQSSNLSDIYNGGNTQDLGLLTEPPVNYYEIETSVSTIQDLIGTAHLVGYNFSSADLVNDAPPTT